MVKGLETEGDRQGWEFAQDKWATVSESLRSLKTNEQPWAIHSGRSEEMSEWAIHSKNVG